MGKHSKRELWIRKTCGFVPRPGSCAGLHAVSAKLLGNFSDDFKRSDHNPAGGCCRRTSLDMGLRMDWLLLAVHHSGAVHNDSSGTDRWRRCIRTSRRVSELMVLRLRDRLGLVKVRVGCRRGYNVTSRHRRGAKYTCRDNRQIRNAFTL